MFHISPGHTIPHYLQALMVRMAGEDFLPTNSRDKKQRTLSITISPKFQGPGDSSLGFLSALAYSPNSSKPPETGSVLLTSFLSAHTWCSLRYFHSMQESSTPPCPVGRDVSLHQPMLAAELAMCFLPAPQMNCPTSLGKGHPIMLHGVVSDVTC